MLQPKLGKRQVIVSGFTLVTIKTGVKCDSDGNHVFMVKAYMAEVRLSEKLRQVDTEKLLGHL